MSQKLTFKYPIISNGEPAEMIIELEAKNLKTVGIRVGHNQVNNGELGEQQVWDIDFLETVTRRARELLDTVEVPF